MNFAPDIGAKTKVFMICRCCLNQDCCEDIFIGSSELRQNEVYQEMLKEVFNIQNLEATVEQIICEKCISKIQAASAFRQMVIQNEETYLKCLQSFLREKETITTGPELKIEEMKLEEADGMDVDVKYCDDHDDDSFDDDEILAHMKDETKNLNILEPVNKKTRTKSKIKDKDIETQRHQDVSKIIERRGTGPILRENSLKLLANSTATIFQWNKSRYRCFCCKEPFSDIILLSKHTEKNHTLDEIQKKIITQQNRLVKVEISRLNCKLCNETLINIDHLKEHLLKHSIQVDDHLLIPFKIENKLKCQICSENFTQFRILNIHMNRHYQKHVCYICGSGFSNLVFLNLHRTRSHRPIKCHNCDVIFLSRTEKRHHDKDVHGATFERKLRFPCPYCQDRFFQENLRVKHLVEKHGMIKPEFNCQFCCKSFLTKSLVNNHVKSVHMKEKNHECLVCHNFFYTKSDVARHRVTHTGEKNFSCVLCSNPFATKDSLRRHMKRTHAQ